MTNYNERINDVLYRFAVDTHESKPGQDETPNFDKAKKSLTSLIKKLVAEAKPSKKHVGDEVAENRSYTGERLFNATIDQYEQNLLKALEEV